MELRAASGQLTLGLAALIARPFDRLQGAATLDPVMIDKLRGHSLGRRALNAATRDTLKLSQLNFSSGFLAALGTSPRAQLAARAVLSPNSIQQRIILRLAAAIEQVRIRNAVLRRDRERLQHVLGEDAWNYGLRRASVFAERLGDLANSDAVVAERAQDAGATPDPVIAAGLGLWLHVLEEVDPALSKLAGFMVPDSAHGREMIASRTPKADHREAAWRVIERGMPR